MLNKNIDLTPALSDYLLQVGGIETAELAAIRELAAGHPQEVMQTTPSQGQLIYFLVRLIRAKRALELGVFLGYSTLAAALALPKGGKIISCDLTDENVKQALPHWQSAGVVDKIDLRIMPALDLLQQLAQAIAQAKQEQFDFVFIDADKGNYENYYDLVVPMLRPGGLLLLDNTLWKGQVAASATKDTQTQLFRRLNQKIAEDTRVTSCLLPLADGLTLVAKT